MDTDALVRLVKALLEAIGRQEPRPLVRVLAPRDAELASRAQGAAEILAGPGAALVFDGEEGEASAHLVPELSCADTADLARGGAATPVARAVLGLLLQGREVHAMGFEHRRHAGAPAPLRAVYEGHVKTLASFGLREVRRRGSASEPFRGALVTAADVRAAAAGGTGTMRVPARAIVTPLARDAAAETGIDIVRETVGDGK